MSRILKPKINILPAAQRKIWPELKGVTALGYVLYGGTAIALRLGHRASVDFDFFTDRALDRSALHVALPLLSGSTFLQDISDTITALVPIGRAKVKVSFFAGLRIGRVGVPDWTDDGTAQVASADDLLATKLKVLLQRVEAKDYLDVAALLEGGADLARGLAAARTLYGMTFQPTECLKALIYFKGEELRSLSRATRSRLTKAVNGVRDLPKIRRSSRALCAS
jgi:Nucleotidyl transferase AbiEii toxin, Type IV TA system